MATTTTASASASASASATEYAGTRERERTLLDVTLPEVARILEMQQKHIVAPSPSPSPSPAPAPSTVLGVPVDVFRALEPALLERVLRALRGPAAARAGAPRSE
tara:strand:- start:129 stop:443 length:315 start_codon:yes stop_codon:yes gene_type:complete